MEPGDSDEDYEPEEEVQDRGDHGSYDPSTNTVTYEPTGQEGENYIADIDEDFSGDDWSDIPEGTASEDTVVYDTSNTEGQPGGSVIDPGGPEDEYGEGGEFGGLDTLGADNQDGTDGGYNPSLDDDFEPGGEGDDTVIDDPATDADDLLDPLPADGIADNDPFDELLGGDNHDGGGISVDDPMDDADAEILGGDTHDEDGVSIDETDDDPSNDLEPVYDPSLDDEILGGDTHDEDYDGGSIDETDDDPTNDLDTYDDVIAPETSDSDDPLEEAPIDTPTGNLSEEDRQTLMDALDEQYGGYRETDYEALYKNEFTDDLNEDYTAATKGLDYNFLTSADRNQFNTKGNTVNDQQDYLGNLLEGGQNDYLNTMSTNYGRAAINNMDDWYYKNRKGINDLQVADDGTYNFDFTDLDMSSFSDPAASYDPEFFGATAEADSTYFNTGDKLYDKKYEDPDKTYYGGIEGGVDPVETTPKYLDDDDDPRTDFDPMENVGIIPGPNDLPSKKKKKKTTAPIYSQ